MENSNVDDIPIIIDVDDVEMRDVNESTSSSFVQPAEILVEINSEKEHEITNKFLAGKLSFSEYAAQIESDASTDVAKLDEGMNDGTSEKNNESIDSSSSKSEVKTKIPKRRCRKTLPPALKGLVGEANLRYARGDHKTAEKMCLEVIRQVPTASEPFLTLAQIYEYDNPEKSLQFSLIAAHLSPNNEDQWVRLGMLSEDLGNSKQADTCYAKAILINPFNIDLHSKRIQFLESIGEKKLMMKAKMRALNYMTQEHHEILIPMAKSLTHQYHEDSEIMKAMEAMDVIFKKCPNHVSSEIVNIMLELLLQLKNYKYCLEIFVQHCNIDLELETQVFTNETESLDDIQIISYNIPETLPIDLHIKFIICMVHLKAFHFLESLLAPLLMEEENIERNGDLYLDVAEALMSEAHYEDALKLLVLLVKSRNFGLAAVWLRYAECLNACKLYEKAIESYQEVMKLAPQHVEMRHPLAQLLINADRKAEALAVLKQDETQEEIDSSLLFKRCKLLRDLKRYEEFWVAGLLLIARHCMTIRNRDEVEKLTNIQQPDRKTGALRALRAARGEDPVDVVAIFNNKNEPSVAEEFELFKDMVETTAKFQRYDLMQRFTFTSLGSKRFMKDYKIDLDLMAIFACIHNEDFYNGYNLIRDLLQHNLRNVIVWNLYNIVIQRSDDSRHNRFLMRLLIRINLDLNVHILQANNCLVAGTYKYALCEYIELYRIREDPMFAFLVGVTLFQMASQKFSARKNYLVVQGAAFFNVYKKLRGIDGLHEVNYNLGRGFHQLGLVHIAAEYYKRVLNVKNSMAQKYPHLLDLKREAAFNLHLIYKSSGSHILAKMCLYNYIVV